MGEPVYISKVHVTRNKGPLREAQIPGRSEPVKFGVHSQIALHYGISEDAYEPEATTLDYVVAAAGG